MADFSLYPLFYPEWQTQYEAALMETVRAGDKGSHYRRLGPEPGTRLEMIPREPRLAGTR
jgi:hypothetical protein